MILTDFMAYQLYKEKDQVYRTRSKRIQFYIFVNFLVLMIRS